MRQFDRLTPDAAVELGSETAVELDAGMFHLCHCTNVHHIQPFAIEIVRRNRRRLPPPRDLHQLSEVEGAGNVRVSGDPIAVARDHAAEGGRGLWEREGQLRSLLQCVEEFVGRVP